MQQILPTVSSTKLLIIRFSKLLNFKNAQEKNPQAMISENLSEMNLKIWNQYLHDG